jgi:hypothetical protein
MLLKRTRLEGSRSPAPRSPNWAGFLFLPREISAARPQFPNQREHGLHDAVQWVSAAVIPSFNRGRLGHGFDGGGDQMARAKKRQHVVWQQRTNVWQNGTSRGRGPMRLRTAAPERSNE